MISAPTRLPTAIFASVPAHYFKIDSSLVEAAPTDRVARAMISAIVRMAGDLGVQTVAESVESDMELQAVRSLGVDYAQGFLLGRPKSITVLISDPAQPVRQLLPISARRNGIPSPRNDIPLRRNVTPRCST